MRRHILTIGIRGCLLNTLENTAQKEQVQIISQSSMETAEWLLAHRRFAVVICDLELFLQRTPNFLNEIRQQPPYIIVIGNAGTKYDWRVEDDADLFLSYQTPLSKLWAIITSALSSRADD
ncbi:hypothetical protein D3Z52_22425 [Clostridiaceae bacterium]|nr:hypothetical protein [Clostridiaceae bacterium]